MPGKIIRHSERPLIRTLTTVVALMWLTVCGPGANATELVAVQPLTDRILMLHFDDGYVEHHRKGQPRSAEKVVTVPLDVDRAALPRSYRISSTGDVAFKQPLVPVRVGRKSKGTDFAWFADKFENGRVI
ncbi:MAG: hypothetical protein H7145_18090, partial [Akkermansiaceae bacterium]|nr:hypothetical protein [Armatimonadota bacterium]